MELNTMLNTVLYKGIRGSFGLSERLERLRSTEGLFGSGFYFTNLGDSKLFGQCDDGTHVLAAQVSGDNPLIVKGDYDLVANLCIRVSFNTQLSNSYAPSFPSGIFLTSSNNTPIRCFL